MRRLAGDVALLCTVRGCGRELRPVEGAVRCGAGHCFDLSRGGWINLLQPQDRRSRAPGDQAEVIEARNRTRQRGSGAALDRALLSLAAELGSDRAALLDVGCGDGHVLSLLASSERLDPYGVDLSRPAIQRAARAVPRATLVIANADRGLPFAARSFRLALSIDARRNPCELARVVTPDGRLAVAVPAPDDLVELRAAVQGRGSSAIACRCCGRSSTGRSSWNGTRWSASGSCSIARVPPTRCWRPTVARVGACASGSMRSIGSRSRRASC